MELLDANLTKTERAIYQQAQELLASGVGAPTFSARLFGPEGALQELASDLPERQRLVRSELYRWLQEQLRRLQRQEAADFERTTDRSAVLPAPSGRLTVVVPRSLHAALKYEAVAEGVSLAELMRLKLTIPYRQMLMPASPTVRTSHKG